MRVFPLAWAMLVFGVAVADARDVTFPIRLDDRFLTRELARSAFTDPDGTAHVFADESDCNSLVLFDPRVASEPGALRVRSAGEARFGVSAGGRCLLPLSWTGQVELIEEPRLERGAPVVRFVVTDSRLLDPDGGEPLFSGTLWGWVKDYVHPRLETRVDLAEPVAQLREVLPAFGVGEPGSPLDEALGRLSLDDVELSDGVVQVRVRIPLPDAPPPDATPEPAGSVAPLSPEELRRWQQAIEQWDAFLTFVVKVTGADTQVLALRRTLLSILLDERYALAAALTRPDASVHDPVRPLFLRAWQRLAPALREVADGLPADQALRYLSFVSAGDALAALDQLGPESGIEISADGLRRLARLMVPSSPEDPLAYTPGVDPQLRELFGFGAPLPPPEENAEVDADAGAAVGDDVVAPPGTSATPDAAATTTPAPGATAPSETTPAPSATAAPDASAAPDRSASPREGAASADGTSGLSDASAASGASASPGTTPTIAPIPTPDVGPTSWLWGWLGGTAWAAELPEASVVKRLNAWAPTRADIAEYAPLARRLLDDVTTFLLARHEIDPAHADVFRALVPATAWKESCWRQYVGKGGKLVPLTSGAGAVGIMQVNVAVWRGFYDPGGLKRDIAYNARAGGEILSRYWTDYAVPRGEAKKGGGVDALARATYAAYNGGPGELARYRDRKAAKRERVVDTDFFVKYQRMKAGDTLAVVDCYLD
ncbi:lytic transglycosylase domain-containing protein [Candidatus Binatia bacterium]|nr:lytic transglycosylase domain-containing protein [Candidatus Binatia bacterium]